MLRTHAHAHTHMHTCSVYLSFYIVKKGHIHLALVQYVITRVRWLNYRRLLYFIILVSFYRRSDSSEVMEVYPLPPFLFFLSSPFCVLVHNVGISSEESYQRVITIEHNPLEIYMSIQFSYIRFFLVY